MVTGRGNAVDATSFARETSTSTEITSGGSGRKQFHKFHPASLVSAAWLVAGLWGSAFDWQPAVTCRTSMTQSSTPFVMAQRHSIAVVRNTHSLWSKTSLYVFGLSNGTFACSWLSSSCRIRLNRIHDARLFIANSMANKGNKKLINVATKQNMALCAYYIEPLQRIQALRDRQLSA